MMQGHGIVKPIMGVKPEIIFQMINRDVVEQHIDDVSFQWLQHVNGASRADYSFEDLAELDGYIDANLEGICLAQDVAWEICQNQLDEDEYIFPATVLAVHYGQFGWLQQILDVLNEDSEKAFIDAVSWMPYSQTEFYIRILLKSEKAYYNYLGLCICFSQRKMPLDISLEKYLNDDVLILKQAAMRLIGALKLQQFRQSLHPYLIDANEQNRFEAVHALTLLGERTTTIPILTKFISQSSQYQIEALQILLRIIDESTQKQLINSFIVSGDHKTAIRAISISGYVDWISWLLGAMAQPTLARLAGEAFSMITGVDLDYEDLIFEEDELDGVTEDDDDESDIDDDSDDDDDVESDIDDEYEEDLPIPDLHLVNQWWQQYQSHYYKGMRYLAGKEINEGNLYDILKHGFQRQRYAAALELALLAHDNPFIETRCRSKNQINLSVEIGGKHG